MPRGQYWRNTISSVCSPPRPKPNLTNSFTELSRSRCIQSLSANSSSQQVREILEKVGRHRTKRQRDLLHLTLVDCLQIFKKNSVPDKFYICTTSFRYAWNASLLFCGGYSAVMWYEVVQCKKRCFQEFFVIEIKIWNNFQTCQWLNW